MLSENGNDNDIESDEEELRNTVGNVPLAWYDEIDHIGYDLKGEKIRKPAKVKTDQMDEFIKKFEDENYMRTVTDNQTGEQIVLSDSDIDLIKQLIDFKCASTDIDEQNFSAAFMKDTVQTALSGRPEHKRSFVPSKLDKLKVGKLVHAIKMGWIKPKKPQENQFQPKFYDIWGQDNDKNKLRFMHNLPAPKLELPGNELSYNPPLEYLLTESEENKLKEDALEDSKIFVAPRKFNSLRLVPTYDDFIKEQFNRCLDMYLCPRQMKMRVRIDAEDLLPKLPKPKDLQPFPSELSLVFKGHAHIVRSISLHPSGEWLVSGSDDKSVKFWEVSTGRCLNTLKFTDKVLSVSWIPVATMQIVAVLCGSSLFLINPKLGDKLVVSSTDTCVNNYKSEFDESDKEAVQNAVEWKFYENDKEGLYKIGYRLELNHAKNIKYFTWHQKGDYFSTVVEDQRTNSSVIIHQFSKQKSLIPFQKLKGLVQQVKFHPSKPIFFVATQKYIKIYDLVQQSLIKKLFTNCKWVSSIDIHPGGDNLIVGSFDSRVNWFDLDLSTKPYKTLKHHKSAVRHVNFHKKYPLFATASDDGNVVICHGMVYNDLNQNALLIPLKMLKGHEIKHKMGVLSCEFHPKQPWIITAGADKNIFLYSN